MLEILWSTDHLTNAQLEQLKKIVENGIFEAVHSYEQCACFINVTLIADARLNPL